jgi:hypothetical protein
MVSLRLALVFILILTLALPIFAKEGALEPIEHHPIDPIDKDPIARAIQIVENLIFFVADLNLARGISNSLDAKLDNVVAALSEARNSQIPRACGSLDAFQLHVMAQSGKQISETDALTLLKYSDEALLLLACP